MKSVFALAILCFPLNAYAQSRVDEAGTRLARQFNDCVLTASLGITGERHAAAEIAFAACATEEQAIRAYLSTLDLPRGNLEAVIINRKLALKKIILQDPK